MKKWFVALFAIVLLAFLAGAGGMHYVKPDPSLDLAYDKVPIGQRALDMLKRQSLELVLTEDDLNNLMKASLAEDPVQSKDVVVRGARFSVEQDLLIANLSLMWKDKYPVGMKVQYRLKWSDPNVVGYVDKVKLRKIPIPASTVSGFVVPIGDELPKPLQIEKIEWGDHQVTVKFKKPSLSDLRLLTK